MLTHGLVAGVIGYAVVVVFYATWNVAQGRSPFFTAALLGGAAFYGLEEPGAVVVWAGPVLAFNGLHLVVFLGIGMIAAWLATVSEHGANVWYVGLSLLTYGLIHVLGMVLWVAEPLRGELPTWSALLATVLALGAMALYLLKVHPRLQQELREYDEDA